VQGVGAKLLGDLPMVPAFPTLGAHPCVGHLRACSKGGGRLECLTVEVGEPAELAVDARSQAQQGGVQKTPMLKPQPLKDKTSIDQATQADAVTRCEGDRGLDEAADKEVAAVHVSWPAGGVERPAGSECTGPGVSKGSSGGRPVHPPPGGAGGLLVQGGCPELRASEEEELQSAPPSRQRGGRDLKAAFAKDAQGRRRS